MVSRLAVITCLPSLNPRASIAPGAYFTFHAKCESFFMSLAPRLWPLGTAPTRSRLECTQTAISLPSMPRPIPVREEVQHRLAGPPRLKVEKAVLRETAGVDDAVLRADIRPAVRRGFAAIVEACPDEAARQPGTRVAEAPPTFARCAAARGVGIVRADIAVLGSITYWPRVATALTCSVPITGTLGLALWYASAAGSA